MVNFANLDAWAIGVSAANIGIITALLWYPIKWLTRPQSPPQQRAKPATFQWNSEPQAMMLNVRSLLEERGEEDVSISLLHSGEPGDYGLALLRGGRRGSARVRDDMGANELTDAVMSAAEKLRPPQKGSFLGAAGGPEDMFEQEALNPHDAKRARQYARALENRQKRPRKKSQYEQPSGPQTPATQERERVILEGRAQTPRVTFVALGWQFGITAGYVAQIYKKALRREALRKLKEQGGGEA